MALIVCAYFIINFALITCNYLHC